MAQVTLGKKEPAEVVAYSSDSHTLICLLDEKSREVDALKRKVQTLEHRLLQRVVLTENKYGEKKRFLDSMCDLCYKIFLENPNSHYTYDEFIKEFERYFPKVPFGHVQRRLRDLRDKKLLYSDIDETTKEVRFWLRLEEEMPADEK